MKTVPIQQLIQVPFLEVKLLTNLQEICREKSSEEEKGLQKLGIWNFFQENSSRMKKIQQAIYGTSQFYLDLVSCIDFNANLLLGEYDLLHTIQNNKESGNAGILQ